MTGRYPLAAISPHGWKSATTTPIISCVISKAYLTKPYSRRERLAAQWAAAGERPNFVLPILIEERELRTLLALIKRCDLYGIDDEDAVSTARRISCTGCETGRAGAVPAQDEGHEGPLAERGSSISGGKFALSNIAVSVPRHFLGREQELGAIDEALNATPTAIIAALYGLRGVGKTTLAAAYAQGRKADYRATWWVRAQTADAMRADLVSLGVRLGWVAAAEKEEPGLGTVRERLRDEGEGLLLIFDNAPNAASLRNYLPTDGARVLVTSTATPGERSLLPWKSASGHGKSGRAISSPVQDASRSARRPRRYLKRWVA